MNWKRILAKGYTLYCAIGFVILIPVMSYHIISEGQPKKILLFVIPTYILLAWSFFAVFKAIKTK
jgi:hypothetical protein